MTEFGASIVLPPDPSSARAARHFVVSELGDADPGVVEAAALLTTELATNAILHAATEFTVRVRPDLGGARIELSDRSPTLPVRRRFSTSAGTGRGLQLLEAMASRWGVEPAGGGKTVFFEVDASSAGSAPDIEFDVSAWPTLEADVPNADLVAVCLIGVPLALEHRASEHFAELFREFALIAERHPELRVQVPGRLLALVDELNAEFSGFTTSQQAEMTAARDRGDATIDLEYHVPAAAGVAAARLERLLDEADEFCRAGGPLLTLATPGEALAYRRWYCRQFVEQCAGGSPTSWTDWPG